jgi:mannose-6-phosphate isomerase-like protein (cupin superfamily)
MNCSCVRRDRPWGWYEIIDTGANHKVKRIYVNPNARFSLQYHNDRIEHWNIVEGSGLVQLNEYTEWVYPGKHFHIPINSRHRMTAGDDGVLFIEVQYGKCHEDDIVRLEDDYGRIDMNEYYTD